MTIGKWKMKNDYTSEFFRMRLDDEIPPHSKRTASCPDSNQLFITDAKSRARNR
jgi:hypothetical protein